MRRAAALWLSLALSVAAPMQVRACDIALLLAVDVSGSVDPTEFRIQMGGLAQGLRAPEIVDALVARQAWVAVMQWSSASRQRLVVDWRRVLDPLDVAALAAAVDAAPRVWRNYSTDIRQALDTGSRWFGAPQLACERQVIDVSGDGEQNEGPPPGPVAQRLAAAGFTINGLAIEGATPDLTGYYRDNVIAGPRAFVETADGFEDYPRAIRRKLFRELTEPVASAE